jgi:hypothetical protein
MCGGVTPRHQMAANGYLYAPFVLPPKKEVPIPATAEEVRRGHGSEVKSMRLAVDG